MADSGGSQTLPVYQLRHKLLFSKLAKKSISTWSCRKVNVQNYHKLFEKAVEIQTFFSLSALF